MQASDKSPRSGRLVLGALVLLGIVMAVATGWWLLRPFTLDRWANSVAAGDGYQVIDKQKVGNHYFAVAVNSEEKKVLVCFQVIPRPNGGGGTVLGIVDGEGKSVVESTADLEPRNRGLFASGPGFNPLASKIKESVTGPIFLTFTKRVTSIEGPNGALVTNNGAIPPTTFKTTLDWPPPPSD